MRDEHLNTPLQCMLEQAPATSRLKSRKPFYKSGREDFSIKVAWRNEWQQKLPRGGDLIQDPTKPLPGFDTLTRRQWTLSNRIRSGQGRTAVNMHRWGLRESPLCPACQEAAQDTDHLVLHCPITRIPGGYETINEAGESFITWANELAMEV